MASSKFRLVTRSDFDGLVCGMLLRELNLINEIKFVHPKDMQDGTVPITDRDIVTNLPYVAGCHLTFDHHASEVLRAGERNFGNHVMDPAAPSAARVVYNYYGGTAAFPRVRPDLMVAVDKADFGLLFPRRYPRSTRLGAAEFPYGFAYRARPLPQLPHLELRVDDAADRTLSRPSD